MNYFRTFLICGCALWLSACAHSIEITPDRDNFGAASFKPVRLTVGLHVPPEVRAREITTAAGGGDKVAYFPYRDLEAGLYEMLTQVFERVKITGLRAISGSLPNDGLTLVVVPTILTDSRGSGIYWPPTFFTVRLTCTVSDASGMVARAEVVGVGTATQEEFSRDRAVAAKRASRDALDKMRGALQNPSSELAVLIEEAVFREAPQRGRTALMLAADAGRIEIVDLLRADGTELNAKDDSGKTALFYAAESGRRDVVAQLLQAGALHDAIDNDGNTPLHAPADRGHAEIVMMLLGRGVAADTSNKYGRSPLMLAAAGGHADVVKLLIDAGANARAGADNGIVLTAAVAGYRDVVAHLIDAGAEPVATTRTDPEALFASAMTYELSAQRQAVQNRHETAADHFKRAASYYERTAQMYKERADSIATRTFLTGLGKVFLEALGEVAAARQAQQQTRRLNEAAALGRASREGTGHQGYIREFERLQRSSAATAASQYHWSAADAQRSYRASSSGTQASDAASAETLAAYRKAEGANRGLAKLCTDLAACYEAGGGAVSLSACVGRVDERHRTGNAAAPS